MKTRLIVFQVLPRELFAPETSGPQHYDYLGNIPLPKICEAGGSFQRSTQTGSPMFGPSLAAR
jgi:hypothetical protein